MNPRNPETAPMPPPAAEPLGPLPGLGPDFIATTPTSPEAATETVRFDALRTAFSGLRNAWQEFRAAKLTGDLKELSADETFHQAAATAGLDKLEPAPRFNSIAGFAKKHRTTLGDFGEKPRELPDRSLEPRNGSQERVIMTNNLRVDAINRRRMDRDKYRDLYGPVLFDIDQETGEATLKPRREVKRYLNSNRYTHGEKRSIKAAHRKVRRIEGSMGRIIERTQMRAEGQDAAGKEIAKKKAKKQRKLDKLT